MQWKGVKFHVTTYNAFTSACAKGSDPAQDLRLFEDVRGHGINQLDIVTDNAMTSASKTVEQHRWKLETTGTSAGFACEAASWYERVPEVAQQLVVQLRLSGAREEAVDACFDVASGRWERQDGPEVEEAKAVWAASGGGPHGRLLQRLLEALGSEVIES